VGAVRCLVLYLFLISWASGNNMQVNYFMFVRSVEPF